MSINGPTPSLLPLAEIDISAPEFWLADRDYREAAFRTLREQAPVTFFAEHPFPNFPLGPGYWALTRHDDVWHASRNPQVFCSSKGTNIPDLPMEINEFMGSMINMDDPKHYRLRSIVSKGFTPKEVAKIEGYVATKARTIIDDVIERFPERECDFVDQIAAKLPLQVICEMMGIPQEDEQQVFHWTNVILGAGDPDYGGTFENLMTQVLRDVPVRAGARRGSPRHATGRHHERDDARRGRR